MSKVSFDTNILIYSIDLRDRPKHDLARTLVRRCGQVDGVISLQCRTEFYRATTRKKILNPGLAFDVVERTRTALKVVPPEEIDLFRAMQFHALHKVQFFDAVMRATVERAGATILLSEDFSHRSTYFGLTILNPFLMSEAELDSLF